MHGSHQAASHCPWQRNLDLGLPKLSNAHCFQSKAKGYDPTLFQFIFLSFSCVRKSWSWGLMQEQKSTTLNERKGKSFIFLSILELVGLPYHAPSKGEKQGFLLLVSKLALNATCIPARVVCLPLFSHGCVSSLFAKFTTDTYLKCKHCSYLVTVSGIPSQKILLDYNTIWSGWVKCGKLSTTGDYAKVAPAMLHKVKMRYSINWSQMLQNKRFGR